VKAEESYLIPYTSNTQQREGLPPIPCDYTRI